MNPELRIAIDFSQLDAFSPALGQYRYAIDLVRALARLQSPTEFLLLGSKRDPVPELQVVFQEQGERWKYRQLPRWEFRGSAYLNHLRYSLVLLRERVSLLHSLHSFVPLLAPCPVVNTIYDLIFELFDEYEPARRSRPYQLHRWAVKHLVRRIVCISQATATDLRQRWAIDQDKVDVIPLGSDLLAGGAGEDQLQEVTDPGIVLLSPFNLEPRKNLDALLEATALLSSSRPELKLILFGHAAVTPEREGNFERRVRELGIGQHIVRTGPITDPELATLYRQATVFVFPSLYEGFGLPLLEAMSAGAAVVARNASAMAEVVGGAGVLVETDDPKAMADAIAGLLDDANQRAALGRRARERAAGFSIERMANLTYRSYLTALNRQVNDSPVYVNG